MSKKITRTTDAKVKCVTLPSLCLSLSTNPEFSHSLSHRLSHSIVFQNPFFVLSLIKNHQNNLYELEIYNVLCFY